MSRINIEQVIFKKGQSVEVQIQSISFGGSGVGKIKSELGDFVIFIEGAIPGDTVKAKLTKIKKNYAEGFIEEILIKSPDRISPKCKHFGVCGGCSMQHMKYEDQLKYKTLAVKESLEKLGRFKNLQVLPAIGCANPEYYRNKMEYSFGFERGSTFERGSKSEHSSAIDGGSAVEGENRENIKMAIGLHPKKNFRNVFQIQECFLQSKKSVQIACAVLEWANLNELKPFDPRVNAGILKNLFVREAKNTSDILINLVVNGNEFDKEKDFTDFIKTRFPEITSIYLTSVKIRRGFKTVTDEKLLFGKRFLTETLTVKAPGPVVNSASNPTDKTVEKGGESANKNLTLNFEILPQAFFQPNTKQAEVLYSKILEFAELGKKATVLDLFCGTGTIGMFFSKLGHKVIGIELNESAIENAKSNAVKNALDSVEFLCGDIEKFFPLKSRPELLITDPPRAGIFPKALEKIINEKIPKWIYVSCNPTTLARDLAIITGAGYEIQKVQPVDMFPQTYHIETICLLTLQ